MAVVTSIETTEAFAQVLRTAVRVIGNEEEAMRWLGTPVRALNYATPISVLNRRDGQDAILAVLNQAEHGVF